MSHASMESSAFPIACETGLIADDIGEFFAPATEGAIDWLLTEYAEMRARIDRLAVIMAGELGGAVGYFLDGNDDERRRRGLYATAELFKPEGAHKALDAVFWRRALDLTGVRDLLPQERRDGWDKDIEKMTTPPFSREWIEPTITELLDSRERFFAEKVDGIFRRLSPTHLTNAPEGFGKRFILSYAFNGTSRDWSYPNQGFQGYMHDLRMVIARFMGETDPEWGSSHSLLCCIPRTGEWQAIDGGSLRIRAYLNGNAHIEVHPDMAWRLNRVLAHVNPRAIPSRFREPPKTRPKNYAALERPLPWRVRSLVGKSKSRIENSAELPYIEDKHLHAQVADVLRAIGGVETREDVFSFEYDPDEILDHIHMVGTLPDEVTHQYYPTPPDLARDLVAKLQIGGADRCLEPSAGQGAIASLLPADRTTCVELSELHCKILRARGIADVQRADFLEWAKSAPKFGVIAMNPPFSQGRAEAHLRAAAALLAPGGQLGAVLPASMAGKGLVAGAASHEWSDPLKYPGVSIKVCTYIARMP
jgi:hypothetical protein